MLFDLKLIEQAVPVCQLNKDKIDQLNKANVKPKQFAKKAANKKPNAKPAKNKSDAAYQDKGFANNPFAALLKDLK